jgi:hypothetical protein
MSPEKIIVFENFWFFTWQWKIKFGCCKQDCGQSDRLDSISNWYVRNKGVVANLISQLADGFGLTLPFNRFVEHLRKSTCVLRPRNKKFQVEFEV